MSPPLSHLPDGQAAIDRLRASSACAQSVRIEDASASVPKVPIVKLRAMALAERPNHFRFDLWAFSQHAGDVRSDGQTVTVDDERNHRTEHLPATSEAISSALGIGVTPNVIAAVLLGRPPVLVHSHTPSVRWESGHYAVEIESTNGWRQHVELIPRESDWNKPWGEQRMRLLRVRVTKDGLDLYDAKLGDYAVFDAAPSNAPAAASPLCDPSLDAVLGKCTTATASVACSDVELPMNVQIESGGRTVTLYETKAKTTLNPPIEPSAFGP